MIRFDPAWYLEQLSKRDVYFSFDKSEPTVVHDAGRHLTEDEMWDLLGPEMESQANRATLIQYLFRNPGASVPLKGLSDW